jgi:hypothetical protein
LTGDADPGKDVQTTVGAVVAGWLGPMSDEAVKWRGNCRSLTGGSAAVATAAGCIGSYCDDMYLQCQSASGISPDPTAPLLITNFVSEENGSPAAKCPGGSVINGLEANGSFSDNVAAVCVPTTFDNSVWAPMGVLCNWTYWVSDEIGTTSWPYGTGFNTGRAQYFGEALLGVATALRCAGSNCDNMSYFACSSVNYYNTRDFSTGDDRGYVSEGDWSPGDNKGECESSGLVYMTGISANGIGISPELRPHRALCVGQNDRLDIYGSGSWSSRLHSHSIATRDDRADSGTGDWDQGFLKAECGRREVMVGVSQNATSHRVSRILCAPMNQVQSNDASCNVLTYSSFSDNRLNTLSRASGFSGASTDWDQGFSKNECGLNQVLKGVSANPSTGEIHSLLCCDQQPDAL